MTKDNFESLVGAFVDQTIVEVLYFDFKIPDVEEKWGQPWHGESPTSGSIGSGAELHMESGDLFWVTYGSEFFQYGVSLQFNPEERRWQQNDHFVSADVSNEACWPSAVGCPISAADVFWGEIVYESSEEQSTEYPQDVGLTFESGHTVYFSALQIMSDGSPAYFADEIRVLCSKDDLKRYSIGPYATSS